MPHNYGMMNVLIGTSTQSIMFPVYQKLHQNIMYNFKSMHLRYKSSPVNIHFNTQIRRKSVLTPSIANSNALATFSRAADVRFLCSESSKLPDTSVKPRKSFLNLRLAKGESTIESTLQDPAQKGEYKGINFKLTPQMDRYLSPKIEKSLS